MPENNSPDEPQSEEPGLSPEETDDLDQFWDDMAAEELEDKRRISQFQSHLNLMHDRAFNEACGSCYLIIEERHDDGDSSDALAETTAAVVSLVSKAFEKTEKTGSIVFDNSESVELPIEGWREGQSQNRFIQFSFERNFFCMDLPRQTLYRPEAEQICRDRTGFFYLDEQKQFTLHGEDVEGYDPFRKAYVYGDEATAAEDTAFIFFKVWNFPVDWRFFLTAAAFSGKFKWEKGVPVE